MLNILILLNFPPTPTNGIGALTELLVLGYKFTDGSPEKQY